MIGLGYASFLLAAADGHAGESLGAQLPLATVVPFVAMLLSIAMFPLFASHWWERNRNKAIVAALLAGPLAVYMAFGFGSAGVHELSHKLAEYVSFIALLAALFVISGGIYVQGSLSGTPLVNTGLLAFGGMIASLVGTTGASVLLIRPLLRANAPRQRKAHVVVFFIFIVSNCGGLLTPLGDPPLFLGFLDGVPFEWTLRLWKEWAFVNGLLLVIFNVWDQVVLDKEEKERPGSQLEEVMRQSGISGRRRDHHLFGRQRIGIHQWSVARRLTGRPADSAGGRVVFHNRKKDTSGQPLQFHADQRSRHPLRRDLRDDDAGPFNS
jgi:Na+/H+ antiporter NhaD/arsenite permease-like protein